MDTTNVVLCWYCDDIATTKDHIKPRTASAPGLASVVVPACKDCNCNILNDLPCYSDQERGKHVARVLLKRLKKTPKPPAWTEDEMVELSHKLQALVRGQRARYEALQLRVGTALRRWGR